MARYAPPFTIGQKFERLTIVARGKRCGRDRFWECICDCGKTVSVRAGGLRSGASRSCGCLKIEVATRLMTSHGASRTHEWTVWVNMKQRCLNPRVPAYVNYGGRGITVCDRWLKFENFLADMGLCPPGHMIERTNNDVGYQPGNCVWATGSVQMKNRRSFTRGGKLINFRGEQLTVHTLAKRLGLSSSTLYKRLDMGWTVDQLAARPMSRS